MATEKTQHYWWSPISTMMIISGIMMIISVGGVEPARSDLWRSLHRGREMRLVNTGGGWLSWLYGGDLCLLTLVIIWRCSIHVFLHQADKETLTRRIREILHQCYKFGFEVLFLICFLFLILQQCYKFSWSKLKLNVCTLSNCSILIYLFVAVSQRAWTSDNRQERLMGI